MQNLQNVTTGNNNAMESEQNPEGALEQVELKLWHAAADGNWDLVAEIVEKNPKVNVNVAPLEGPDQGKSVLWLAAKANQWKLVEKIIENNPSYDGEDDSEHDDENDSDDNVPYKANVNAAPQQGSDQGKSVL